MASPDFGSTFQMDPYMPTAIHFPSGDQAGAHGVVLGDGGK